jgi:hypothetical protein
MSSASELRARALERVGRDWQRNEALRNRRPCADILAEQERLGLPGSPSAALVYVDDDGAGGA